MPSAYETFGIAALEASACNLPVIAPQVGGLKSVVKHGQTGFLSVNKSPESLMHYLEILLKNKPCRGALIFLSSIKIMAESYPRT